MAERITRRWGFPFLGYRSSVKRFLAGSNYLTGPWDTGLGLTCSMGCFVDPLDGKLRRRSGCEIFGAAAGVLETVVANASAKARRIYEFESPSIADGYPAPLVLFTDESKRFAWLYWRSTNGADFDLNLGETFGSTHYPTGGGVAINARYIPFPYIHNATGMSRLAYEATRRYFGQGSRTLVQMGGEVLAPALYGMPVRWDRKFNDQSGTGTEVEHVRPIGLLPPLWSARGVTADIIGGSSSTQPWKAGDQFYISVAFEDENGEISMPFIPGASGTAATVAAPATEYINAFGLATVPTGSAYYASLRYRVPLGPHGTRRRLVLRSGKVDSTVAGLAPNPLELFITGIINNNTATLYDDPNGNDASLVDDPALIRLDRKWPSPARYNATFDHRHAVLYTDPPNPGALILAPTGFTTSRDHNVADSHAFGNETFVRVVSGAIQLKHDNPGTATHSISTSSSVTLRSVLETIQQTTPASTAKEWGAQLAPGTDDQTSTDNLALTYVELTCSASNGSATMTTAGNYNDVAVGMKVNHANVPAGTHVKSIESSTSLTLSANTTGAITGATVAFHVDTGDDAIVADGTLGNIRAFAGSWPVVLGWKKSYLDSFASQPRDVEFTAGGPGDPPLAGNSFVVGNRRTAPSSAGYGMGLGSLLDGAVVLYSKALARLRNIRGGKTGEDSDYRLEVQSWGRGCISPPSVVESNGVVGFLSASGYVITDGQNERIITSDIYNPGTRDGDLAYEIGLCQNAAAGDTDDYGFFAHVRDGRLWISFRLAAGQACIMCYDFSPSAEGVGLAQILRPDGTPYGWSTPLFPNAHFSVSSPAPYATGEGAASAIGSVRKSDGVYLLQGQDSNTGTNCGRLQRFENGAAFDAGNSEIECRPYLATDNCGTLHKKSAVQVRAQYRFVKTLGGMQLNFHRLIDRATTASIQLPATGSTLFDVYHGPMPSAGRSVADTIEPFVLAESINISEVQLWGIELDLEVLPSYRTQGG